MPVGDRRVYTSGEHKAFWIRSSRKKLTKPVLAGCAETPISKLLPVLSRGVVSGLKDTEHPELFSVWFGRVSKHWLNFDALGNTSYVAREVIGEKELVGLHRAGIAVR